MSQIRPFDFNRLKKLNRKQIEIEKKLMQYFEGVNESHEISDFFNQILSQDLGEKLQVTYQEFCTQTYKKYISDAPQFSVSLVLGFGGEKWLLRIDSLLVLKAVDLLLGGSQSFPNQIRALSASEEGVFQYLMIKVLSQISKIFGKDNANSMSLLSIHYGNDDLDQIDDLTRSGCAFRFNLKMASLGGAVTLFLPDYLLEGVLLRDYPLEASQINSEVLAEIKNSVGFLKTDLHVELGHVILEPQDLRNLEEGDVVLFDETMVQLHSEASDPLSGRVILRVGEDRSKGLLAEVISGSKPAMMKVLDFYGGD